MGIGTKRAPILKLYIDGEGKVVDVQDFLGNPLTEVDYAPGEKDHC